MTATGHAIIGTLIAATIPNPWIAGPLAVLSHLAADSFPHWDLGTNEKTKTKRTIFIETIFDVLLGFVLSYLLIIFVFPQTNLLYACLMIILAQGLDWAWAPQYFFKIKNPISEGAIWLGKIFDSRLDKPWGIINQIAVLILLIIVAKLFFY
jgi:hypothetical protein